MSNRLALILSRLSEEQLREVEAFAERLESARSSRTTRYDTPDGKYHVTGKGWHGALAHLKDKYKSGVELQHDLHRDWEETD